MNPRTTESLPDAPEASPPREARRGPVYLDHHATTPVDPRVLDAMLPYFSGTFGNAASRTHPFGWAAEEAVEEGRRRVAAAIGALPREIVFTSGATESNNIAILGAARAQASRGRHVVTVATEHRAVLDPVRALAREGFEATILPVDGAGRVDLDRLAASLRDDTVLVSVMAANNEIGTLAPLADIARLAKARGIWFHTDAAQAAGKVPFDVREAGVDLASLSAHKVYGPKGVGALYVRARAPRVRLEPILFGGGHERGLRSGTLNVPGIVGFGRALEIALAGLADESARIAALRDRLEGAILAALDGVRVNGDREHRLPGNLHLSFDGVDGDALLMSVRELAVSAGSACTSSEPEPSHVLRAIGVADDLAEASIRFGLGRGTTPDDVAFATERVVTAVRRLRGGTD